MSLDIHPPARYTDGERIAKINIVLTVIVVLIVWTAISFGFALLLGRVFKLPGNRR